ncbi:AAA family ATPase [Candidatus Bathyarchaeota archaeon]|nr:AAA family ATPase [Candidatus Bathyarchaeota archaeon]
MIGKTCRRNAPMLKLTSISVKGFKNLDIKLLNFPPEGNILVMGKNESGKSTLFEAIYLALAGDLLVKKERGNIDAIGYTSEAANITLRFQKNGRDCSINRQIIRGGNGSTDNPIILKVNIGTPEEQVWDSNDIGINAVKDHVQEFLGFDGDILRNSSFVEQKGLDGFIETGKRKKKEIINKLLNLENFSILKKQYK